MRSLPPSGDEGDRLLPNSNDNDNGQVDNHAQLVTWVQSETLNLPEFDLSPMNSPIRSAAAKAGYLPVSLDNASDFNQTFKLAGRDALALRSVFSKQVRQLLLQHPDWIIESRSNHWLFYQLYQHTDSQAISGWLNDIQQFLDQASASG